MLCAIWYHLYNVKNVKNTHREVLLLVKNSQTSMGLQVSNIKHNVIFCRHDNAVGFLTTRYLFINSHMPEVYPPKSFSFFFLGTSDSRQLFLQLLLDHATFLYNSQAFYFSIMENIPNSAKLCWANWTRIYAKLQNTKKSFKIVTIRAS